MASGFKQATVNASDVPATQSNFPAYVDLSRIGITTQAEADSVRCYSDSGKTTELAREIVSATEMHVKIPSLTSTFTLYVDYDGARSDYLVTDTYGRNAVWSAYGGVWHMEEDPSGTAPQLVDSTGNGNDLTTAGSMTSGDSVTGQIGNGVDFDTTNDTSNTPDDASLDATSDLTIQTWFKLGETNNFHDLVLKPAAASWSNPFASYLLRVSNGSNNRYEFALNTGGYTNYLENQTFNTTSFFSVHATYDQSNMRIYHNGSELGAGKANSTAITSSAEQLYIGNNTLANVPASHLMDETRISLQALSANWITTEYNNQNDEATFWGTWTDVGAAAAFIPKILSS